MGDAATTLRSIEEERVRMLRAMADGALPIHEMNPFPSHARRSVVGPPTATMRYHGRDCKCVVRVHVETIIVEDADEDTALPGHRDE